MKFNCTYIMLLICFQTMNAQHFLFDKKCIGNVKTDSLFNNTIYIDYIEGGGAEINNRLTYGWQVHSTYMYSEEGLLEKHEFYNSGDQHNFVPIVKIIRYFYDDNNNLQFKLTGQHQTFLGIKKPGEKYDEDYVFDLRNKITSEKNSQGLETFDYDLYERKVYANRQNEIRLKVQFDKDGNELLREYYRSAQVHYTNKRKYEDGNLIEQVSIHHQSQDSTFNFWTYDDDNRLSSVHTVKNDIIIKQQSYSYPAGNIKLEKSIYNGKEESTITLTASDENQFLEFSFEKAIKENITTIRFHDSKGKLVKAYSFMPDGKRIQISEHHYEYFK